MKKYRKKPSPREILKPCPFCGEKAKQDYAVGEYWVICCECKASTDLESQSETAIKKWNSRYDDAKLEKAKLHFKEIKHMNRDTDNAEFVFKKARAIAEQALKDLF